MNRSDNLIIYFRKVDKIFRFSEYNFNYFINDTWVNIYYHHEPNV